MFIPKSLYESAPHYWLALGLMMIVVGAYLGVQANLGYGYAGAGAGLVCCLWSVRVFRQRSMRKDRQPCETYDDYLDQTCELNLRSQQQKETI